MAEPAVQVLLGAARSLDDAVETNELSDQGPHLVFLLLDPPANVYLSRLRQRRS
jgi:hypothetical protein